ncbi:MAG: shikimate kinase [Oscillospiraceae bacterium]|jgi:adenylate kinase family enzyme|nr:shikimate kinase [Oscillospiraceae bacterium]
MKIHLLGPSCSGTSTLGKLIAEKYKIPWYDTDEIFWIKTDPPFTAKREINERKIMLKEIFEKNYSLVLSGSAMEWGDFIKEYLDIIIYKYVKPEIRIKRLIARERNRYGNRIDIGNDMYEIHKEFVEWNRKYETGGMEMRSRTSELFWLCDVKCKIIKLEEDKSSEEELKIVSKEIEKIIKEDTE